MEAKAIAKYIRISPNRMRQVVDLIRDKDVAEAMAILKYLPKRGTMPVIKVLQSAVANAEHNYEMDADNLFVKAVYVDQGPTWKRFKPRARGRADMMKKRTSHITVVVAEKEV